MQENKFKYDVAFSFLADDEELVIQINDLIQDRVNTFLYSRKQGEIAGTDGEKTFNRVFGSEAIIVFVLYRNGWGKTPWTRIEETAIRNRAFEEGYDFVIFAPLDKPPNAPKWLPKNRIWIGLDRWGIEGVATVIEARIQEVGGSPREETVEDHASRIGRAIAAEKKKLVFLHSENGVKAANAAVKELFDEFERIVKKLSDTEDSISLQIETTREQCAIYSGNFTLFFHWSLSFSNTLQSSAFYVNLWKGYISVRGRSSFPREKPQQLKEIEFNFDQTGSGKAAWRELRGQKQLFSNDQLAKFAITLLLDKIRATHLKNV
ncbi:MAG: hypothetical protein KKF98_14980 [Bacteroidetes bacterium]|nr:hypothetical protein [Bacteroidota bacterium]